MALKQQLEKWIFRLTRSMNLKGKFVLFYGLIIFIPTVLIAIGAGYLTSQSARENYLLTVREAVRQSAQSIEFKKQSYDLLASRTATDGELVSRLSRDYENIYDNLNTVQYVDRSFFLTSQYLPGVEKFRIYHNNSTLVEDGELLWKPSVRTLDGIQEEEWYNQTLKQSALLNWTNALNDKSKIIVTQKIITPSADSVGIIYLRLNYNAVFAEPFKHPFDGAGALYIIDTNGHIVASSKPSEIGMEVANSELHNFWNSSGNADTIKNGSIYVANQIDSNWTVAAIVNLDRMEKQTKRIYYVTTLCITLFVILSTFLILTLLKNIVWRIRKLGGRMNEISEGSFEGISVRSRERDELGELEGLFNSMAGRLSKLLEDNIKANLKEREQSFRALQAQINPHFIYNSLSIIRWRAADLGDEKQIHTIDALKTFYRIALNNSVNVTKIKEEIEHVRAYLEIQQLRYPEKVKVEWFIDESIVDYYTIKLILQPIVENVYLHGGITLKKGATIRISVIQSEDNVILQVEDNGVGMHPDVLDRVCSGHYTGSNNGFGMNNIRERIHLYFGSEGSLSIESVEQEGTTVSIVLPICLERPDIRRGD